MENSGIVYIKFNDSQDMCGDLRHFSSINGLRGVVYSTSAVLFRGKYSSDFVGDSYLELGPVLEHFYNCFLFLLIYL